MQNLKKAIFLNLIFLFSSIVYAAGPVTINNDWVNKYGTVVSGNFTGTSSEAAINVTTKKAIIIQNTIVQGPNNLITLNDGANVVIKKTTGTGTNPNVAGRAKGAFIKATRPANLLVKNCTINDVYFGVYVYGFLGNVSKNQSIKILNNIFNNIDGRNSNGKGGYIIDGYSKEPAAHAIQLNAVRQVPNIEIAWNQAMNIPFQGYVSDVINIYSSSGTFANHIRIHDNYIQGSLGPNPGNNAKYSGGGIITDGIYNDTSTTATAYVDIYNNQIVQTANYGLAIAAGHDNRIYNNRVISSGFYNKKLYAMTFANGVNNSNLQKQSTSTFYNNHAFDNVLGLVRKNSTGNVMRSDWYLPGQSGTENNQHFQPYLTSRPNSTDEQTEFSNWQTKLKNSGIVIGN